MSRSATVCRVVPAPALVCVLAALAALAPAQPSGGGSLVIVDDSGREHKLSAWKFVAGTKHLPWLKAADGDKGGLEVLELTEGQAVPLKVRVTTLVPVESIRSIEFDGKKQQVTVTVAAKDRDLVLTGVTGYVGVNIVAVEAETDLGELGKAHAKFQGGVARGVKSIRFPSPRPLPPVPEGRRARLVPNDASKTALALSDVHAVYHLRDGTLKKDTTIQFEKTVRVDLDKIRKMTLVGSGRSQGGKLVFDVALNNGVQKPLVLVEQRFDDKKRPELLIGLLGRCEAGYTLVPPERIGQLAFEDAAP